jgi:hypothetical protein
MALLRARTARHESSSFVGRSLTGCFQERTGTSKTRSQSPLGNRLSTPRGMAGPAHHLFFQPPHPCLRNQDRSTQPPPIAVPGCSWAQRPTPTLISRVEKHAIVSLTAIVLRVFARRWLGRAWLYFLNPTRCNGNLPNDRVMRSQVKGDSRGRRSAISRQSSRERTLTRWLMRPGQRPRRRHGSERLTISVASKFGSYRILLTVPGRSCYRCFHGVSAAGRFREIPDPTVPTENGTESRNLAGMRR